jgi:hypothetical protein
MPESPCPNRAVAADFERNSLVPFVWQGYHRANGKTEYKHSNEPDAFVIISAAVWDNACPTIVGYSIGIEPT